MKRSLKCILSIMTITIVFSTTLSCAKKSSTESLSTSSPYYSDEVSSQNSSTETSSQENFSSQSFENTTSSDISSETERENENTEYIHALNSSSNYPQIVKTQYKTSDTVVISANVLDFGADPSGKSDSTIAINNTINSVFESGGGTVYIPAGKYIVTGEIEIPMYVSLRGDYQSPETNNPDYGTVILAEPQILGNSKPHDTPLIRLQGNTGIDGLTFYYPDQTLSSIAKYGYTIYAEAPITTTIKNSTFINSSYGIGVSLDTQYNELVNLENIYGTFLFNAISHNATTDVGFYDNININPSYWSNTTLGVAPSYSEIKNFTSANLDALILGDLDDQLISNVTIKGANRGIYFTTGIREENGFWGLVHNAQIETEVGVYADYLNSRSGVVFTASNLRKIENISPVGAIKLAGSKAEIYGSGNTFFEKGTTYDNVDYLLDARVEFIKTDKLFLAEGLDNTGKIDVSKNLNTLLKGINDGILVIPNGIYRLDSTVNIPSGVEVRSTQDVFTRTNQSNNGYLGVVFISYVEGDTFTLNDNSGIRGVRIWHARNDYMSAYNTLKSGNVGSSTSIKADGNNTYSYIIESVGAYEAFDFSSSNNHFVKSCYGLAYSSFIKAGGENGKIAMCLSNPNFMTRTNIYEWFDKTLANVDRWEEMRNSGEANDVFLLLRDDIGRNHTKMLQLDKANGERIFSTFCYGESGLIDIKNSENVVIVNTSLDFIPNDKPVYRLDGGSAIIIGSLRVYGKSIEFISGRLQAYGRIGFGVLKEKAYDSDISIEDIIEYVSENAKRKTLFDCDSINGVNGVSLNNSSQFIKQGSGSWKANVSNNNINITSNFKSLDASEYAKGYLHLYIYCSDASKVGVGQIEITSSSTCDVNELNWSFDQAIKESGWNELWLDIAGAGTTGGDINLSALNYLRIYSLLGAAEFYIDMIEFVAD